MLLLLLDVVVVEVSGKELQVVDRGSVVTDQQSHVTLRVT